MAHEKALDSLSANADGGSMTDRRAVLGAAAGLAGAALGAGGVIVDSTWLGVAAGCAALLAGAIAVWIARGRSTPAPDRSRVDELEARVSELEQAATGAPAETAGTAGT